VIEIINSEELADIWDDDETIGWFYQYFTPKEMREQARAESSAPRNSWELAFRNQFYTPRYVVQFLTDNTLGRMWYEMLQGNTVLSECCKYMAIPKNEVFLQRGEKPYEADNTFQVPFREKKDPRELKILDPACGSGHFLLYVFDLLVIIYKEAYADSDVGEKLQQDYPDREEFEREIPRLILENNLYGIDIDLRAIQIAALALWLRAQREWNEMGVRRNDRPKVRNAHFVCAEPMPGNQKLFEDFVVTLKPALLGNLVRDVWEKMKLAGEAGSLLQIEQELRATIQKAKQEWLSLPKETQLTLFGELEPLQLILDFKGIKDEVFFKEAEEKVFSALRTYAERVIAENHGYGRRLFAEESIRGFQFIETLQHRFDVVLMNPPFGAPSAPSKSYMDKTYPRTKNDVYAAFVERMLQLLHNRGFIGIISSRTGFFLSSFTKWREEILMQEASLHSVADFGFGVLEAMVETAAYTIEKTPATGKRATFFRLLKDDVDAKGEKLLEAIQSPDSEKNFEVELDSFSLMPNTPFSYWVSDRIRKVFEKFPTFEDSNVLARMGLTTADDFRFLRLFWEVEEIKIKSNLHFAIDAEKWINFAKGGTFSPYYFDTHLVINWAGEGYEVKTYSGSTIRNERFYYRKGVTWPPRTNKGFNVRQLNKSCVFGHKGASIFSEHPTFLLGILNSNFIEYLMRLMTTYSWEVGFVQRLPFKIDEQDKISSKVKDILTVKIFEVSSDETIHVFSLPSLLGMPTDLLIESGKHLDKENSQRQNEITRLQKEIDVIVYDLYDIHPDDRRLIEEELGQTVESQEESDVEPDEDESEEEASISENLPERVQNLLMWCVGVVYGRWDVRMALDKSLIPKLADPFDPLPVCSPGMLLSLDGYPATSGQIVSEEWLRSRENVLDVPKDVSNPTISNEDYPIAIDWDGILVDDDGHSDDIVKKVHEVLALIYGESADEREEEILDILGVRSLRDYFRQPKRFFDFHIKRYSKSRRKAPIYWLLQSKKKNYGIWLYYHRLDNDTIFKVVRNYVEPKLNLISNQISELAQRVATLEGREKRTSERELEKLTELRQEITEFKENLEKVIDIGYYPHFDDGVILNTAPLHEIIPWKEPAKYWKELQSGKYDWAHIAMRHWPERVKSKCKKDKSFAIAHGME